MTWAFCPSATDLPTMLQKQKVASTEAQFPASSKEGKALQNKTAGNKENESKTTQNLSEGSKHCVSHK